MTEETILETGDLCLRFDSQEQADEVLTGYTGSIDTIGSIEDVQGWHVNTRGLITSELLPYAIEVETPIRVWV